MRKYGFENFNYYPNMNLLLGWDHETLEDIIACNDNFTSSGSIAQSSSTYNPYLLTLTVVFMV